jgi:hypothetical protein
MGSIYSCCFYEENEELKKEETIFKNHGECAICLDDMTKNLSALPCAHIFHTKCIKKWIKNQTICPICSTPI